VAFNRGRWPLLAGVALVASAVWANSAAASGPTLSLDRSTGLLNGQLVTLHGSGFRPNAPGAVIECSTAAGQPTVVVNGQATPVSCSVPSGVLPYFAPGYAVTDSAGLVDATFVVQVGVVGPPTLGVDSAADNAAVDAAAYPCPPTDAQQAAGATCEVTFATASDDHASVPVGFGTPIASASATKVSPSTGLNDGQSVTVEGSGFTPDSPYLAVECNDTPGEPPSAFLPVLPAACGAPSFSPPVLGPGIIVPPSQSSSLTDPTGALGTVVVLREGNVGGTQQTAAYPCPPSPANVAAGGKCEIVVLDAAYEQASQPITLTGPVPEVSITLFPAGGLSDTSPVGVSGEHFVAGTEGAMLECNGAPGQPTIPVEGNPVPVGCTNPLTTLFGTSPDRTVLGAVRVREGVIGPPAVGTDSAGNNAAADAAAYPCPPTPAQTAAGVTCAITAGDLAGDATRQPIAFGGSGLANAPTGYWLAFVDGGVFSEGGATFYGSVPGLHVKVAAPIAGIAATPSGRGYWLVGADGGVFSFGDAGFFGSLGAKRLDRPIVGIAATPTGHGYWLVGADGGVFAFGDAPYLGSVPGLGIPVDFHINSIGATPSGHGYWVLLSDGALFGFGDAPGRPFSAPTLSPAAPPGKP
jgi:hypothetical protein